MNRCTHNGYTVEVNPDGSKNCGKCGDALKDPLAAAPRWLREMVAELKLQPKTVTLSIRTPVVEHEGGMVHSGWVHVEVSGKREPA